MRDIVSLLQRPSDTTEDLAQRLRHIAARMLAGIVWTFTSEGLRDLPPLEMQRHVVLSFKEMLHNIRKHAAAKEVQIQIACHGRELTLEVCDEGLGFDPTLAPDGHGLVSLRQRALKLGGELRITTAPGKGTRIVLTARL